MKSAAFGCKFRFFLLRLYITTLIMSTSHRQNMGDYLRRMLLAAEIKMRINVGCCAVVRVSQPLLYLFHRHSVCKKQTGTAMSEVMIAYVLQAVFFQQLTEFCRNIVWSEKLTYLIHADIVIVFVNVRITA